MDIAYWKERIEIVTLAMKDSIKMNKQQLLALFQEMIQEEDMENANKIVDLYKKHEDKELVISFAGHFSAGKSSMINALLGKQILPNSPIPTSANIVKLTSGKGYARVYFHKDNPIQYKEPYDIEMIKDYCMDKDMIKQIEINTKENLIPENCIIVDTPGIDAADDADRLMTESSLHLVDALFYVMDYNHVQSEVNLQFLQQIQAMKIPYFIIVNQIDKHDEKELSFENFKHNVQETFTHWGLNPEKVYYTSLFDDQLEINEFPQVKEKLRMLLQKNHQNLFRIDEAIEYIIKQHKMYQKNKATEQIEALYSDDTIAEENVPEKIQKMKRKIEAIEEKTQALEIQFKSDLNTTLDNAYLMPRELRDKAKMYLEANQSDFKVGFFGAKKKTAHEKKRREEVFLTGLNDSIQSNIQWKIREKFLNLLNDYRITDSQLKNIIQGIAISFTKEDLERKLNPGAKVNGNYVLNYTDELSASIKQKYKQQANTIKEDIICTFEEQTKEERNSLEEQLEKLMKLQKGEEQEEAIQKSLQESFDNLDHHLDDIVITEDTKQLLQRKLKRNQTIKEMSTDEIILNQEKKSTTKKVIEQEQRQTRTTTSHSSKEIIPWIDQAVSVIESLPGFEKIIESIRTKKDRLENRNLTIALFGAFSAGKSSLINALIGKNLMPSSPNPTTAVINRISPVSETKKHGTAKVYLKSEQLLMDDLFEIVKPFNPPKTNHFGELLQWAEEKRIPEKAELNKMYQAYIKALILGYKQLEPYIGKTMMITLEEFASFAVEEQKAAYVEAIDLYYDCSITKQGITLVDTPGADSINARHTNVSFDYIKFADAILYVTYYNHALSRADKDFLMQLGRVKESFELDKMFFIINASDLAKDKKELELVTNYVQEQLLQLGIRFPRIYPVSSKKSLEEKEHNHPLNREMDQFEQDFFHFVHEDLVALLIESLIFDVKRAEKTVANYLDVLHLDEKEKENYRLQLQQEQTKMKQIISNLDLSVYITRLQERIQKQIYYLEERFALRFHDMFKDEFNPTTITKSGREGIHQLQTCMRSLLDYSGYELLQEIRAISLRIEKFINDLTAEIYQNIIEQIKKLDTKITLASFENFSLETPEFKQAFQDISVSMFQKALAKFKGTKAFFVNNEKEKMREDLLIILKPEIKQYLQDSKEMMDSSFYDQWKTYIDILEKKVMEEIDIYVDNQLAFIKDTNDAETYLQTKEMLTEILTTIEK